MIFHTPLNQQNWSDTIRCILVSYLGHLYRVWSYPSPGNFFSVSTRCLSTMKPFCINNSLFLIINSLHQIKLIFNVALILYIYIYIYIYEKQEILFLICLISNSADSLIKTHEGKKRFSFIFALFTNSCLLLSW